jgi:hypothetical protein
MSLVLTDLFGSRSNHGPRAAQCRAPDVSGAVQRTRRCGLSLPGVVTTVSPRP